MPTILDVNFGREFLGWPETLEKQGRKIRHQNSLRDSSAIFLKFAGPKQKIHPKSALHNVGTNKLNFGMQFRFDYTYTYTSTKVLDLISWV